MIIEIQVGSGLACDVSGESAETLLRFKGPEGVLSPWLCRSVLERGLQMISSSEGSRPTAVFQSVQHAGLPSFVFPLDSGSQSIPIPLPAESSAQQAVRAEEKIHVTQLGNELIGLVRMKANAKQSLAEREIIETCRRFVRLFRTPRESLRTALAGSVGLDEARYDYIYAQVTAPVTIPS